MGPLTPVPSPTRSHPTGRGAPPPNLGLDPLLTALRSAGLRVGVGEVARLQRVFELEPRVDGDGDARRRLESLLRAVVVKSKEDRGTFERVCDAWFESAAREELRAVAPPPLPGPVRAPARPRRQRWRWPAAAAVIVVVLGSAYLFWPRPEPAPPVAPPPPPPAEVVEETFRLAELPSPDEIRQRTFTSWVPTLQVTPAEPEWNGWLPLALGLLALLTAGGLWRKLGHRRWLPEPAPPPRRKGPPRTFLRPPKLRGPQLLAPREQEALVWGIGRFVSDEPTPRLDLKATVRATAKAGGIPELVCERAVYHREVWLWIDDSADDPAIPRLAGEVEQTLAAHGLTVERATFRGVPERLTAGGRVFAPREIDERLQVAIVAVLTDGRKLTRQYAADDRRVQIDALLRLLSHWPRLAFVDFSGGGNELPRILGGHEIDLVAPEELATFFGTGAAAPPSAAPAAATASRADAAWAAACALSPSPVDEATAFELRGRLGLRTSAWALRALRAEAPGPPGRLRWPAGRRARYVNWLRRAEVQAVGKPGAGDDGVVSLFDRALRFWQEKYDDDLDAARGGEGAELETPAAQYLAVERTVLDLWKRRPGSVIWRLYRFYQGRLGGAVRRHLGDLAADDTARSEERVRLPWRWGERTALEQVMLEEMGFGGAEPTGRLRRPGRLLVGIGVCLGLAAVALALAAGRFEAPAGPPLIVHSEGRPEHAAAWPELQRDGWNVVVGSRPWMVSEPVDAGSRVEVRWTRGERACVETLEDGTELWRCGGTAPPRLAEEIGISAASLLTPPDSTPAEELAVALLASGSADLVAIGVESPWSQGSLASASRSQILIFRLAPAETPRTRSASPRSAVVVAESWSSLRDGLRFDGLKPVTEVWPAAEDVVGVPLMRGLGTGCRPVEEVDDSGMVFVRLCPGTFVMGSSEDEEGRDLDEGLAHRVTVSEFSIGKYEVTNRQYRVFDSDHQGEDDLPATGVSWHEAKAFSERFGYRLPTEAEWEYAARAGTETRWSFGDDESQTGRYAWYSDNTGAYPEPVGTREPNPWGLYDMHGNVWEWVADWYGPYSAAAQIDPTGPAAGNRRVVRGGSFVVTPRDLRSAGRVKIVPEGRGSNLGFRCARSPRRQP